MVPAGGWNVGEQKWHGFRRKFFIQVRIVSALFRGKFLSLLKNAINEQRLTFAGSTAQLKSKKTFNSLLTALYSATRNRNTVLERCRKVMGRAKAVSKFSGLAWQQVLQLVTGKDVDLCPVCQTGRMTVATTFKPLGALA